MQLLRGSGCLWLLSGLLGACRPSPPFEAAQSLAGSGGDFPTVAVDPGSAAVYVVWAHTGSDSSLNVMLARQDAGGPFEPPVRVNDLPGDLAASKEMPPQVVVDGRGVVYVGWVSERPSPGKPRGDAGIRLARSTNGGRTFSPAVTIASDPTGWPGANFYFDLASAPDGSLWAAWLDLRAYADSLAARPAGHEGDVPENHVEFRVTRSADGGRSFGAPAVLDTVACICCRTALASGPDTTVHAIWRHVFPGSVRDFQTARSLPSGTAFGAPVRIHDDHWVINGCPDIGPDIAVDGGGGVHVAWYTGAEGRQGLWYASSQDGGRSFGEPVGLVTKGYVPPSEVKLTALGDRIWGVWEDRRHSRNEVIAAQLPSGRRYSLGEGEVPAIATGGGTVAVAWADRGQILVRLARQPERRR